MPAKDSWVYMHPRALMPRLLGCAEAHFILASSTMPSHPHCGLEVPLLARLEYVPWCFFWTWLFCFVLPSDLDANAIEESLATNKTLAYVFAFLALFTLRTRSRTGRRGLLWIFLSYIALNWIVFKAFLESQIMQANNIASEDVRMGMLDNIKSTLLMATKAWEFICAACLYALGRAVPYVVAHGESDCKGIDVTDYGMSFVPGEKLSRLNCVLPCLSKMKWLFSDGNTFVDNLCPFEIGLDGTPNLGGCEFDHNAIGNFAPLCTLFLLLDTFSVWMFWEQGVYTAFLQLFSPWFAHICALLSILASVVVFVRKICGFGGLGVNIVLAVFLISVSGGRQTIVPFANCEEAAMNNRRPQEKLEPGVFFLGVNVETNQWLLYSLYALDIICVLLLSSIRKGLGTWLFNPCMWIMATGNGSTVKYLVLVQCLDEICFCLNQMLCPWYRLVNLVADVYENSWSDYFKFGILSSPAKKGLPLDAVVFGTLVMRHRMNNMRAAFLATREIVKVIKRLKRDIPDMHKELEPDDTKELCRNIQSALDDLNSPGEDDIVLYALMKNLIEREITFTIQGELPLAWMQVHGEEWHLPAARLCFDAPITVKVPSPLQVVMQGLFQCEGYGIHLLHRPVLPGEAYAQLWGGFLWVHKDKGR